MRIFSVVAVGIGLLGIMAWTALASGPVGSGGSAPGGATTPGCASQAGAGGLIALACQAGDHRQQLTVVDPSTKVVGVYHIDTATGDIVLKSVRNIHWDLQMVEFNGASPSPREIRTLLEQR